LEKDIGETAFQPGHDLMQAPQGDALLTPFQPIKS
jgi:hypothetical protein